MAIPGQIHKNIRDRQQNDGLHVSLGVVSHFMKWVV
jgi:hypothetical protein